MYAVVKTGGKQYRVAQDDVVTVERLEGEAGAKITLGAVIAIGDESGIKAGPALGANATVEAEIVKQARGPKIIVFKKRRRQNSRRKNGHRQDLTVVKIEQIVA